MRPLQHCARSGKVRHGDVTRALAVLAARIARGFAERRVYRCGECEGYHLTSKGDAIDG